MSARPLLLVMLVSTLLMACGSGSSGPKSGDPPAPSVIAKAATGLKDLKSFHFRLEHENGATQIPLNLQLTGAEGDAVVPDRLSAEVTAKAANTPVTVKVIGIGNDTWITNPFSRQWQKLGGVSVRDIADPASIVNDVVRSLRDTVVAGHATLDGVDCYRITGQVDSAALTTAFSSAEPGLNLAVEVWVGVADSLPRRVRLKGPVTKDEAANIVRVVTLSKFNQSVSIQPPQ
jgi:hypothetical protein